MLPHCQRLPLATRSVCVFCDGQSPKRDESSYPQRANDTSQVLYRHLYYVGSVPYTSRCVAWFSFFFFFFIFIPDGASFSGGIQDCLLGGTQFERQLDSGKLASKYLDLLNRHPCIGPAQHEKKNEKRKKRPLCWIANELGSCCHLPAEP